MPVEATKRCGTRCTTDVKTRCNDCSKIVRNVSVSLGYTIDCALFLVYQQSYDIKQSSEAMILAVMKAILTTA